MMSMSKNSGAGKLTSGNHFKSALGKPGALNPSVLESNLSISRVNKSSRRGKSVVEMQARGDGEEYLAQEPTDSLLQ